jgi:hypothetical protein
LRAAAQGLSDFEKQGAGPLAQQAAEMRQNMEMMANHIQKEGSIEKIDSWLHTIEQWQKQ